MNLNLEAAANRSRYEMSSPEESSPLGWESTMRNIKQAGDIQFAKKHAGGFYRMGEITPLPLWKLAIGLFVVGIIFGKSLGLR